VMQEALQNGPDLAGVRIPAAKNVAATTAVRSADQNPSRLATLFANPFR